MPCEVIVEWMMPMNKTYSELIKLSTFEERFKYLKLEGTVCEETFGFDRYLNQIFYKSEEWKRIRRRVIIRDNGCDLAWEEYEIKGIIIIHHINPITKEDILDRSSKLFDLENLICTSVNTHKAIHYGNEEMLPKKIVERTMNDTCPWK